MSEQNPNRESQEEYFNKDRKSKPNGNYSFNTWVCPGCGSIYNALMVSECHRCNPAPKVTF